MKIVTVVVIPTSNPKTNEGYGKNRSKHLSEVFAKVPMVETEKTLTWVDDSETTFLDVRDGNSIKETGKIKAIVHAERDLLELLADQEHSMGKSELSPCMRMVL